MNRSFRFAAALMLAVMLPIQGWAAACAQICALVQQQEAHVHATPVEPDATADSHDGHCGNSEMGAGKCCQAHVFLLHAAPPATPDAIPSFERSCFVARWANFIPEEPSPPPIVTASIA